MYRPCSSAGLCIFCCRTALDSATAGGVFKIGFAAREGLLFTRSRAFAAAPGAIAFVGLFYPFEPLNSLRVWFNMRLLRCYSFEALNSLRVGLDMRLLRGRCGAVPLSRATILVHAAPRLAGVICCLFILLS